MQPKLPPPQTKNSPQKPEHQTYVEVLAKKNQLVLRIKKPTLSLPGRRVGNVLISHRGEKLRGRCES